MAAIDPVSTEMLTIEELVLAGGDPRVAFPQLDPRTVQAYAQVGSPPERPVTMPDWHTQFEALFQGAVADLVRPADVPQDAALAAAFSPMVRPARREILEGLVASAVPIDADAIGRDIERAMYQKLFAMGSRALILELAAAQSTGLLQGATAQDRFHFFCSCLKDPAFARAILSQYPVLVRQATLAVAAWRDALLEFAERLSRDEPAIAQQMFATETLGRLSRLHLSAGDSHRGGRSVIIAEFDGGARKLVYKPRSLQVDRCFADLVAWLGDRGLTLPPRLPVFIDRPGYGWVEHIKPAPCRSADDVAQFYRRQGVNVGLLYVLKGTDLHSENIIAAGADPVLIDLEALFHPTLTAARAATASLAAQQLIDVSALATGIIPVRAPRATPESDWLDMSGMSGADAREIPFELPVWVDAETDNMRLRLERTTLDPDDNLPQFDGKRIGPGAYIDAVLDGFTHVYEVICANRDALLAPSGPIAAFADAEVRVIVRNTARYEQVIHDGFAPRFLHHVREREAFFDTLWSEVVSKPVLAKLHRAERHDLWNGDVPVFSTTPSSTALATSTGEDIADAIEEPAMAVVRRRIATAGSDDLAVQRFLIEASLADARSGPSRRALAARDQHASTPRANPSPLRLATEIGDQLIATSVRANGGASWIVLEETDGGHASLGAAALDLYSGLPGMALFLSGLAKATVEHRYQLLADEAVADLADLVAGDDTGLTGYFTGLSGIAYAMAWHDGWHHGPTMQIALDRLGRADMFDATEDLDVISGLAGASLALLSAWRRTGIGRLREHALEAGRALLRRAVPCQSASRSVGESDAVSASTVSTQRP